MAGGQRLRRVIIGRGGLLSTPAASCLIRKHGTDGGIILSASHNPGGPEGDFGIKFNSANGGPAPEAVTDAIYRESHPLITTWSATRRWSISTARAAGTCRACRSTSSIRWPTTRSCMETLFDFDAIAEMLGGGRFRMRFDAMHASPAPMRGRFLEERLGAPRAR
jgi:phosphoglucomutase